MPFTPAHTAIVLPFLKTRTEWMSATALVLGSMIPDFEYFIFLNPNDHYGHTLAGIIYFDIPMTVACAFLFHMLVKKNLFHALPGFIRNRFQPLIRYDFAAYFKKHYAAFIILATIGIASHLLWDGCTHANGWFVKDNAFMLQHTYKLQGARYPYFYVAQYLSSFVGMIIVTVYVIMLKRLPGETMPVREMVLYWLLIVAAIAITLAVRLYVWHDSRLENIVIDSLTGFLYGLILGGLIPFHTRSVAAE